MDANATPSNLRDPLNSGPLLNRITGKPTLYVIVNVSSPSGYLHRRVRNSTSNETLCGRTLTAAWDQREPSKFCSHCGRVERRWYVRAAT